MALFYAVIYLPARYYIGVDVDSFETLSVEWRAGLVFSACILLALIFTGLPKALHKVGVPYVIERLNYYNGNLPIWNAVVQFVTAAIGLVGGLSIGKEGPAVHLGATLGGYLAGKAKLPQYGVETLLACGVAGAISAIFQTPLAGVLFAFEVIFLEYRQRYVLPVLLSSVIATLVSHYFIGPLHIFSIDSISSVVLSLDMFLACFVLVVFIVLLSALFLHTQKILWRFSSVSVWVRFSAIAVLTALAAVYFPEALGSGYGPLTDVLSGEFVIYSLFLLVIIKTLLTAFTVGLGIPGGMIGPTFIIGGLAGAQVAQMFESEFIYIALFALLGMAAMMAASFQAPLTALVAIVEMTNSSEVIVPALFVIVLSCLLIRVFFHQESVFVERLSYIGMASSINPLQRYLRQHTVKPVSEQVLSLSAQLLLERVNDLALSVVNYAVFKQAEKWHLVRRTLLLEALQTLDFGPQPWLVVDDENVLMDLTKAVESMPISLIDEPASLETILSWFQATGLSEVLVALPDNSFCLVSRQRLDQFLLEDD
ncbi:chloride channel protein [Marinomonas ushuaiensis DSM 15871]|uniref:Chloride channel protein n=1 Tax=Marinomonas ushuaiensis DSM 15871 TaxID=1122207 RepID=X7E3W6_9GAMM|nr:chloride channel protein [Marinomonas ushuaiensis]ETX10759.1 chloride channel protein [Marinomonas ushuaiensis DSM 15871]